MKLEGYPLTGKSVFLSASKPARDLGQYRPLSVEIDEAVVSLSRAVFSAGGQLVFGAHPSISPLVASVATEYGRMPDRLRVSIYQSEAYRGHVPLATLDFERLGFAKIIWTPSVGGERFDPAVAGRPQCTESLRLMRTRMLQETSPIAMVAIGGMQGVEEEARMFVSLCHGNVYALQTTGGAAATLSSSIPEKTRIRVLDRFLPAQPEPLESGFLAPYPYLMQRMVQEISAHP
jgi:hypothetical protein